MIFFRIREIHKDFPEIDKDNNDVSEAKKAMAKAIEKRIQTMINEADVDGDGKINFLEFHEAMKMSRKKTDDTDSAPPTPPDGGWGWVVVFACFMSNFMIGTDFYSYYTCTNLFSCQGCR